MPVTRRRLLQALPAATLLAGTAAHTDMTQSAPLFEISLAQWSLHRAYFGDSLNRGYGAFSKALVEDPDSVLKGSLDPLDFAPYAKSEFGIDAVEYVNTFYFGKAQDADYLRALRQRAEDAGVQSLLIMCDALGATGAADADLRAQAIENHVPWLEAASFLGCRAVRVNAYGEGSPAELAQRVSDSLHQLGELAQPLGLYVLVENHGGLSSNAAWLADVIAAADHPQVGTLPDFGNFRLSPPGTEETAVENYDRYLGVSELMPFARSVSAKSYDFDARGNETTIDYLRMLGIVVDAGYSGHVGIEYEGRGLSEVEGIRATQQLLERVRGELQQR
jgi:sugar phosphate isomerase/epimerase